MVKNSSALVSGPHCPSRKLCSEPLAVAEDLTLAEIPFLLKVGPSHFSKEDILMFCTGYEKMLSLTN